MNDDRLALSVTRADGLNVRWGPDEADPTQVPDDLQFGTVIPGGFRDLSCSLLREYRRDYSDAVLFADVKAYGAGRRTAWEGRLVQVPEQHEDRSSVTPGAVGHAVHLRDDPGFMEVYVDRDPGRWGQPTLARQNALLAAGYDLGQFTAEVKGDGILWSLPVDALSTNTLAEVHYYGPVGCTLSAMQYKGKTTGTTASIEAPGVFSSVAGVDPFAGPNALTLDDTIRSVAIPDTTLRSAMMHVVTTGAVTPAIGTSRQFSKLAMFGGHDLTRQTTGELDALLVTDVVADVIRRAAPLLNFTTGPGGSITSSGVTIPHAVFAEPTTAETALLFLNAYLRYLWGVYDDRQFFLRPADPTLLTWNARRAHGAKLSREGATADRTYNGVIVIYDSDGAQKIVGPPAAYWAGGVARADNTDASLVDASTANPINAAGIPRKWGIVRVSEPTTLAGATQIGVVWLAAHALAARRGTLTLTNSVEHPVEGMVPTWRVRAGDYAVMADRQGDEPRLIVDTTYNRRSDTVTCSLDDSPHKLDALLSKVGVQQVDLITA